MVFQERRVEGYRTFFLQCHAKEDSPSVALPKEVMGWQLETGD